MTDLSSLVNIIPNDIVNADFISVNDAAGKNFSARYYLLGDLPNNKKFLLPKYTTDQRNLVFGTSTSNAKQPGFLIYNSSTTNIEQFLTSNTWQPFNFGQSTGSGEDLNLPGGGSNGDSLVKDGSGLTWKPVFTNPLTSEGDILVGGKNGILSRLGKGSEGQVLSIVDGYLAWVNSSATNSDYDTETILADCSSSSIIVYCPKTPTVGQILIVKRIDSNPDTHCIVDGNGNLIDSDTTIELSTFWDSATLQWTGHYWIQI